MRLKTRIRVELWRRCHRERATQAAAPVVVRLAGIAASRVVSCRGTCGTRVAAGTGDERRRRSDCRKTAKSRCRKQREHGRSAAWLFAKSNVKSHPLTWAWWMTRCLNTDWE